MSFLGSRLSGRLAIAAFAAGCGLLQTRAALPDLTWAGLLPLAGVLLWRWRPSAELAALWVALRAALMLLLIGLAGFYYAAWRADLRMAQALSPLWEGRDIHLIGRVAGLPEAVLTPAAQGTRFVLDVAFVTPPGAQVPPRVRLSAIRFQRDDKVAAPVLLRGGDCVALTARLSRPHGNLNPAGLDYEAWLLERGIRATGNVQGNPVPAQGCGGQAWAWVDAARDHIRNGLQQGLGAAPYAGVVVALAVGDQDAIPSGQWTLFRQTGTSHLFSVSGLHITLFSALVYALVRLLWRRAARLNLWLPAHRAGLVLGLLAATAYTLISGFGIPAQRTLAMLAGAAVLAWMDHAATPSRVLSAALMCVVLLDPWAALSPGFWLSFTAVALLLWAGQGQSDLSSRVAWWRRGLHAQWAVTIGLMPLLLALFQEVSLVSPLANALAIPTISLLAVPLSLLAALLPWPVMAEPVQQLAHGVVQGVMLYLQALAELPQPVFHAALPTPWALGLAFVGTALLLLPRGFPARWLGWVMCLPLLFPRLPAPPEGQAWLTVLDVGQGEAVLLRTAHHALLVDAGPHFDSGEDAGSRVVAPVLWAQGITRLDGLVLTHDDMDHSGGVASVLASHKPVWFLTSLAGQPVQQLGEIGRGLMQQRPDALACKAGQRWRWDGVEFAVLHPPAHHFAMQGYADNDRGCVIAIQAGKQRALLAADIERLSEMNLAERAVLAPVDVLVVPHHGSKSSSSEAFLRELQPRLAIVPVGHRNRYGHPHAEVMARYRQQGIVIQRTDRDGAVTVQLGESAALPVETARATRQRYWHAAQR